MRPRGGLPHATRRWGVAFALALSAALPAALAQDTNGAPASGSPSTAPSAPSPSEPPFWARPRAAPPVCDTKPPEVTTTSAGSTISRIALGAGAVILGFILLRMRISQPAPARGVVRRPESAAGAGDGRAAALADELPSNPLRARSAGIELRDPLQDMGANEAMRFYAEVASSLAVALKREPEREDLQLKLLEVYHAAGRINEFIQLARVYFDQHSGSHGKHWREIAAMGYRLAPDHVLFREWHGKGDSSKPLRGASPFRRFHEVKIDQGKLYGAQKDLTTQFERLRAEPSFQALLSATLTEGARRPSPLAPAPELGHPEECEQVFLKREDLHRSHDDVRINALCQTLVARQLRKTGVVTATYTGLHGQAVAATAARFGLSCTIYLSESAMYRHYAQVLRMRQLGAQVRPVSITPDSRFADPRQFALDAWLEDPAHLMYISDLDGGPEPYPTIVREFQMVVGRETMSQLKQLNIGTPTAIVAGAMDGYLGLGLLHGFVDQPTVQLYCVGPPTVPGFERERRRLRETGRVNWAPSDPNDGLAVVELLYAAGMQLSMDAACTLAFARNLAGRFKASDSIVVLLSGPDATSSREYARNV